MAATHRICKITNTHALLMDEVKRIIGLSSVKFIEPPLTLKSTINEYFNSKQVRDVSELLDKSPDGFKAIELMQRLTAKSTDCVYVAMSTTVNLPKLMMFYTLQCIQDSMVFGSAYCNCDSLYGCVMVNEMVIFITVQNLHALPIRLRNSDQKECPVCLEVIDNPRLIRTPFKCRHWICQDCLDMCRTDECSLCREVTPHREGYMVNGTLNMNADLPLLLVMDCQNL